MNDLGIAAFVENLTGTGIGHARANVPGPNENIRLDDDSQGIKHIAPILERFEG